MHARRDPHAMFLDILIIVPIHVSRSGNVRPWNLRMSPLDRGRKPPRGFGDNFERTGRCVEQGARLLEPVVSHVRKQLLRVDDVVPDMQKAPFGVCRFRRHTWRRLQREGERTASRPRDRSRPPTPRRGSRYSA